MQRLRGADHRAIRRFVLSLIVLVGLGGFGLRLPVQAAPALPAQTAVTAAAIRVVAQAAKSDFPNKVTFTLTAESDGAEIAEARLFYRPVASEVSNLSVAQVTRGRRIELNHSVDMTTRYLPPG